MNYSFLLGTVRSEFKTFSRDFLFNRFYWGEDVCPVPGIHAYCHNYYSEVSGAPEDHYVYRWGAIHYKQQWTNSAAAINTSTLNRSLFAQVDKSLESMRPKMFVSENYRTAVAVRIVSYIRTADSYLANSSFLIIKLNSGIKILRLLPYLPATSHHTYTH